MHLLIIMHLPMPGCNLLPFALSVTIVMELSLAVGGMHKSPIGEELK